MIDLQLRNNFHFCTFLSNSPKQLASFKTPDEFYFVTLLKSLMSCEASCFLSFSRQNEIEI